MKKINVLHLIASLCLLFGSIINLLHIITDIPTALHVCALPLLLAAIVLYSIVFVKQLKEKKKNKKDENHERNTP